MKGIIRNYPLKRLTTIRVGGNALFFFAPERMEEIFEAINFSEKNSIPIFILGGGSNCIFGDGIIERLVISMKNLREIKIEGNKLIAQAGVKTQEILKECEDKNLSGLEFIAGVPATVGGMIYMNFGSMGKEICEYLKRVVIIKEREIKTLERNELKFSYRKGIQDGIIIEAEFELEMKDKKEIKEAKRRVIFMRKEKQPIDKKTAGCIFKNPPGNFAGKLIEEAGCKGKRIGDAMVSLKHANFIENMGNAKFEDVKNLIEYIKERVYKKFGINLEEEVIIIEK
ncbi:MAG: UDP-N-acetylmuramate dehydrogenase [candidate division WOR-3 bacterium]